MALVTNYRIFDIMLYIFGFVFIHFPLSQGDTDSVIHLCVGEMSSSIACDSGEVVVIKEVFRVLVPFSAKEHCGYQKGDFKEHNVGATKTVWKDCNLSPNCNVKFVPSTSSRKEFLEIHYECVSRATIPAQSICQAIHFGGNHGYIHSPGYPGLMPSASIPIRCNCSASLNKTTKITVKVFNTFTNGVQTLKIKWNSSSTEIFKNRYPHFKEYTHIASDTFSLEFWSNIRDSKFWLEYNAGHIDTDKTTTSVTASSPTTTTTTTTVSQETPTITTTTTATTVTTQIIKTTATANSSVNRTTPTTKPTSNLTVSNGSFLAKSSDMIDVAAGSTVSVVVIVAVIITVVLLLRKRRAQGKEPKDRSEVGLELQNSIDNPVFDPESGEKVRRPDVTSHESRTGDQSDGPSPLSSDAGGIQVGATVAEGEVKKRVEGDEASNKTPFKPNVKPKPGALARQEEVKVEAATTDHLAGDVSATEKPAHPKPKPKPEPAPRNKQGSRMDAHPDSEEVNIPGIEVYAEVLKTDKGRSGGSAEQPETPSAGQHVNVGGDIYAEVDKNDNWKTSKEGPAVVKNIANISNSLSGDVNAQVQKKSKSTNPVAAPAVERSEDSHPGDIYAQVDKTRSKPQVKKKNKGVAQELDANMDCGISGDVYAQVQKGNKGKQIPSEAYKPEAVKSDLDVHNNVPSTDVQTGERELYSSGDDINSEVPPVGDMESYTDDGLYGSVDDLEPDYDHAYAEERGFTNDEDDTYDRLQRGKPAQSNVKKDD